MGYEAAFVTVIWKFKNLVEMLDIELYGSFENGEQNDWVVGVDSRHVGIKKLDSFWVDNFSKVEKSSRP